MKYLILTTTLLTVGCMSPASFDPVQPNPQYLDQIAREFRSPASAQFQSVRQYRAGSVEVVCALANGQNGFGGNTGFQPLRASVQGGKVTHVYYTGYLAVAAPC